MVSSLTVAAAFIQAILWATCGRWLQEWLTAAIGGVGPDKDFTESK